MSTPQTGTAQTGTPQDSPRDRILDAALPSVAFDGWTGRTLREATARAGLPEGSDELLFPGGELDLLAHWHERTLDHVESELAARGLGNMGTTARVREGCLTALEAITPHEPAMRRATARLALPDAGAQGPRQLWEMADAIWHAAGDTSTDSNHYTKRAILAGVLGASVVAWCNDTSPGKADARAFLDRRLADAGRFGQLAARARGLADRLPDPGRLLGSLRYGGGPFSRPSTRSRRRRGR